MAFQLPPSFFGMLGLGKPNQMPEQQNATRQGIMNLVGQGVRKLAGGNLDPNNMSPTENAGNVLSNNNQSGAPARTREMPNLLSTIPNQAGMALPPPAESMNVAGNMPNRAASATSGIPTPGKQSPLFGLPQMNTSQLPGNLNTPDMSNMIPGLNPTNLERVARAPSRVGMLQGYKDELSNLSDPVELGNYAKNNRSKKGRVMDGILGAIRGFGGEKGQGAIAGYTGEIRKRNEMNRVQEENDIARKGIMDRYGVDREILGQENIEENQYNAQRKQAFDMDKELNDQSKIQADQKRQQANDQFDQEIKAINAKIAIGGLTREQGQQLINERAQRLKELEVFGAGQPVSPQDREYFGLAEGAKVPARPADAPNWRPLPEDSTGKIDFYDPRAGKPNAIQTPPKAQPQPRISQAALEAQAKIAATKAASERYKDIPEGQIPNPKYDMSTPLNKLRNPKQKDAYLTLEQTQAYKDAYNAEMAKGGQGQQAPASSAAAKGKNPELDSRAKTYESMSEADKATRRGKKILEILQGFGYGK